jgi:branched-chain amino acid transport system substrate-binding protein
VTDDDISNDMGDGALGVVTSHHYSARTPTAPPTRSSSRPSRRPIPACVPNFMAVGGYDGMRVIYEALKATKGEGGGEALLAAMKGQAFESPRGQIKIDPQTRDIVQDVYLRKVEKKDGSALQRRVRCDQGPNVKDPGKARK